MYKYDYGVEFFKKMYTFISFYRVINKHINIIINIHKT